MMLTVFLITACGSGSSSENSNDNNTGNKPESSSSVAGYKPDAKQAASKGFFTVGDIDNPALVSLTDVTDDTTISDQKIVIKAGVNIIFDGTADIKKGPGGIVTLGILAPGIAYSDFKDITADATIDITVSAKVNGKNIAKTFVKTKTPFTDIYSWRDIDKVSNDLGASYTLKNDIAFPVENTYGYTDTFNPIGTKVGNFSGKFDGTGKKISGLKITGNTTDFRNFYVGLFGSVSGANAEIKNLVIDHRGISGENYVGAVAGSLLNGAVITNVGMISTTRAKITGTDYVGGLAGEISDGTLTGYATGAVRGNDNVGGLTGRVKQDSTLTGYATGAVSGAEKIGGLVGIIYTSRVTGYATGAVSSSSRTGSLGGLVGFVSQTSTVTGYATGAVIGNNAVGGLLGVIGQNGSTATGYARGTVIRGTGTENIFGLLIGQFDGNVTKKGYYSATESTLVDSNGTELTGTTGFAGDPVTMAPGITQTTFDKANTANPGHFTFGTATGEWTWVKDGNWPAINLPPEVGGDYSTDAQPTGKKPTTP